MAAALPAGSRIDSCERNTLRDGRVLDGSDESESTPALRAFDDHVRGDPRVVCVSSPSATA